VQKWLFLILLSVSSSLLAQGPPTITGLSPTSGSPGTMVTITGTNFISESFRVEEVYFDTAENGCTGIGGTGNNLTVISATELTVEVPPYQGPPTIGYVCVKIIAGPTAGQGVSPGKFTITSGSAPTVAPKVTLTGDLPDSTATLPNAQCLNSSNDPSTSTAGVYDYGQCDDNQDFSSINFYYKGPVELEGSTSDECTVRVFDDGLLRVTFDSTTDCTVDVTATRATGPILTLTGDEPRHVKCDLSGTELTAESGGTATERQYDLGNCPDVDLSPETRVTATYDSNLIQFTNGPPASACILPADPFLGRVYIKIDSDCTINVTVTSEATPGPTLEADPLAPATPVPTLPFYALFLMAGLLGIIGLRRFAK